MLKPCPFCKSIDVRYSRYDEGVVECIYCGAHGPYREAVQDALSAWNRRAPTPEREALERLVEAVTLTTTEDPNTEKAWKDQAVALDNARAVLEGT